MHKIVIIHICVDNQFPIDMLREKANLINNNNMQVLQ